MNRIKEFINEQALKGNTTAQKIVERMKDKSEERFKDLKDDIEIEMDFTDDSEK